MFVLGSSAILKLLAHGFCPLQAPSVGAPTPGPSCPDPSWDYMEGSAEWLLSLCTRFGVQVPRVVSGFPRRVSEPLHVSTIPASRAQTVVAPHAGYGGQ